MAMRNGYKQSPEHVAKRIAARLATLARNGPPVAREWLEEQYIGAGRTTGDIAAELGCDAKTVWSYLKRYGIPTRPRGGHTMPHCFRKGQPSLFAGRHHTPEARDRFRQLRLADGRAPYLKNGTHWLHQPGAVHPNWRGGVTPERQSFYLTAEWREACKAVWQRADAKCERCGVDHRTEGNRGTFHVHHIVSFMVRELRAEPSNLALLCAQCHRFVHSNGNEGKEFIKERP